MVRAKVECPFLASLRFSLLASLLVEVVLVDVVLDLVLSRLAELYRFGRPFL